MLRTVNRRPAARPDHVLFCRIRNEDYFIRHFLDHYRRLGIEHFYFADDQSTDGTREHLLGQDDCTVIEADFRFSEQLNGRQAKLEILRAIPEQFIGPGWITFVDADEFLQLPSPYSSIGELTSDLEAQGRNSCIGAMVDFYPATLRGRSADRSLAPIEAFPFFDAGPYFIWPAGRLTPIGLFAGVRHRLNEWMFEQDGPKAWTNYRPTMLQKVPLIRWTSGIDFKSAHTPNFAPNTTTQVALAHFKFYPDLDAKIAEALESNYYHGGSHYYRLLAHYLPLFEDRSLISLVTRRYRSPADLAEARLLFAPGKRL